MASTYTNILRLELQADGENDGTWGQILNDNVIALIEDAVSATTSINTTGGTETLSTNQGAADEARNAMLDVTGSLASDALIEVPAQSKHYIVRNNTSGSFTVEVLVSGQGAGAGVVVQQGTAQWVYCDGSDVYPAAAPINQDGTLPDVTVSGDLDHNAATATKIASGTTAERPSSPVAGNVRWNEDNNQYEGYDDNAGSWVVLASPDFQNFNQDLIPDTDSTRNLGSESTAWAEVHADKVLTDTLEDAATGNTDAVQDIIDGRAKAWATNSPTAIQSTFNVAGFTENGVGDFTLGLTNNFVNGTYAVTTAQTDGFDGVVNIEARNSGAYVINAFNQSGTKVDRNCASSLFGTLA